jgi:peptidoglycan/LPS O-acetylase OafA/YrhL
MMRPKPSAEILGVSGNRLDFLDALRGIAAVMVFLLHLRAKVFFFQTPPAGMV